MNMLLLLEKALRLGGNTHTVDDLLDEIMDGKKQSFARGDTWVITQIIDFPRKRVLEIFLVVGEGKDIAELSDAISGYARGIKADFIRAQARPGWKKYASKLGFKPVQTVYTKGIES